MLLKLLHLGKVASTGLANGLEQLGFSHAEGGCVVGDDR